MGPISRSLEDIRYLLNVMSGKDGRDQTTFDAPSIPEDIFSTPVPAGGWKVGYYKSFLESGDLDPEIR